MRKIIFVLIGLTVIACAPVESFALNKATKFSVVVVSEEGDALSGVKVGVGFEKNIGWGTDSTGQQGITDADGRLTFSGQSNGHITFVGSKDGCYPSYYDYDFKDLGAFGWEPWNPILKIVMRKIEDQVPMYIKDIGMHSNFEIPYLNKGIGLDLTVGDWVAPFGKGKTSDFVFNFIRDSLNPQNYKAELIISFTNHNDGVIKVEQDLSQGSEFKLYRFAPKDGYENKFVQYSEKKQGSWFKDTFKDIDNFIFRIRSKEGRDGKIESAMYGKIIGPIMFAPARSKKSTIINFKYYLNPDGTRNLEHDPKRNLFYEGKSTGVRSQHSTTWRNASGQIGLPWTPHAETYLDLLPFPTRQTLTAIKLAQPFPVYVSLSRNSLSHLSSL